MESSSTQKGVEVAERATKAGAICEEYKRAVEEKFETPLKERVRRTREKCKKKKCRKLCLCCNKWRCWLETFFLWVVRWVVTIVVKWVPYTVCRAARVVLVVLLIVLVVFVALVGIGLSIREGKIPVYGNYCGPRHGDPTGIDLPEDGPNGVDAACKRHDECYKRYGWGNCDCDLDLIAEMPDAIANSNDPLGKAAGIVIMVTFGALDFVESVLGVCEARK